ncbi:NAD(+)/NADH kinase [Cellulomonas sp. JH27-2]|uniref:NAD(+)/NADH kinase n=1 Tax=Cellulomonas sp. JH27-2 TaxID=2774139 RepID=UPI0017857910|nr:NAD(+)/NADH kinase [Cellulomonas sp. JH27-2]
MGLAPRVVVVHRATELDGLLERHGTRGQAEFFLRTRGRSLADVQDRHDAQDAALTQVRASIPADWRRGDVEREDLYRFAFEPGDVVVVVGQDGLVANVAKYLDAQVVVGVDPEPGRNAGVLVTHAPLRVERLLADVVGGTAAVQHRTMVTATLDDGERLDALNEVFVGHPSHQSARYRIEAGTRVEAQSSSGVIVATGTGATGWAASIRRERGGPALPAPDERALGWYVREAWPSPATGTSLTSGLLDEDGHLRVVVASDALVVFGDGLEQDRLTATWGQTIDLAVAGRTLALAVSRPS